MGLVSVRGANHCLTYRQSFSSQHFPPTHHLYHLSWQRSTVPHAITHTVETAGFQMPSRSTPTPSVTIATGWLGASTRALPEASFS